VDKVARFRGGANSGVVISPAQVTARGLDIAIQPGVATPAQMRVLNEVVEYGASVGVNVRIIPVH
jgi:hypothetical protein